MSSTPVTLDIAVKRAEEALRDREERYRTLFDAMDEGYCIIEVLFDAQPQPVDYRFIEVNGSFERQAGMHDVRHSVPSDYTAPLANFTVGMVGVT